MSAKLRRHPKIVVIGGGTGLPVILKSFRNKGADITAIVTVADDGGSSGEIREDINVSPPGDLRNVLVALSDVSPLTEEIFQYRFKENDGFISNHTIGNLVIAALSEMSGSTNKAIELLTQEMHVDGKVIPASEQPLILHAVFKDGTHVSGESKIADYRKMIDYVYVTNAVDKDIPHASPQVIEEILEADMVVLGPGSLYTSILPNLMIPEINQAISDTHAEVVYICNIMTQKGETEHFTDADHIRVLHHHVTSKFIDTVLVNTEIVPEEFPNKLKYDEVLDQVVHDFKGLRDEDCRVISADFLELRDGGVFHDGDKVVSELFNLVFGAKF